LKLALKIGNTLALEEQTLYFNQCMGANVMQKQVQNKTSWATP